MTRLRSSLFALFITLGLTLVGTAAADTVWITDISGMTPTVKVLDMASVDKTSAWVTILPDTSGDFLHFRLAGTPSLSLVGSTYTDLFSTGGVQADRLIVTVTMDGKIDVQYGALPGGLFPPFPSGAFHAPSVTEKPDFDQQALVLTMTGIDDGNYHFYVRTPPPPPVPEPASLILIGTGFLAGVGFIKRRKDRPASEHGFKHDQPNS